MAGKDDEDLSGFRAAAPTEVRYVGPLGDYFRETEEEPFMALLPGGGGTVLDLGCGTGRLLERLRRGYDRVIGIDISEDMLRAATARRTDGIGLILGDFQRMPLADGCCDAVLALGTFHLTTTEELHLILGNVAALLKPGGHFVFTCWNARPWAPRRLFQGARAAAHELDDLIDILDAAGFGHPDISTTFFVPPNLFWAGYKLSRGALRRAWVDAVIRVTKYCRGRAAWHAGGGEFIVAARRR